MSIITTKRLLGKEDVQWDLNGTDEATTFTDSNGIARISSKINCKHMPLDTVTRSHVSGAKTVAAALQRLAGEIADIVPETALSADTTIQFAVGSTLADKQAQIDTQLKNLGGHTLTFIFPELTSVSMSACMTFSSFENGTLIVDGNGNTFTDTVALACLFLFQNCACKLYVRNFDIVHTLSAVALKFVCCPYAYISGCTFQGASNKTGTSIFFELSNGVTTNCSYTYDTPVGVSNDIIPDLSGYALLDSNGVLLSTQMPTGRTLTALSGLSVIVAPDCAYTLTADGDVSITLSGWTATGSIQFSFIQITLTTDSTITVAANAATIRDAIMAGYVNYCIILNINGDIELFVADRREIV